MLWIAVVTPHISYFDATNLDLKYANATITTYTLTISTTDGGTTDPPPGTHPYAAGSSVEVTAVSDTCYQLDHWKLDGDPVGSANPISVHIDNNHTLHAVFVYVGIHDVAVTNVTPSKTVVGQGYSMSINVTVENQGNYTETFNVTTYCDSNVINYTTVTNLPSGEEETITFTWNTTGIAKGNYTISAYAWPVLGEVDTADNTFIDGWIIVSMLGDITGEDGWPDSACNMRDVGLVARYFGQTVPPAPPNCDLTGETAGVPDGIINMRDVGLVASHFGETDP